MAFLVATAAAVVVVLVKQGGNTLGALRNLWGDLCICVFRFRDYMYACECLMAQSELFKYEDSVTNTYSPQVPSQI